VPPGPKAWEGGRHEFYKEENLVPSLTLSLIGSEVWISLCGTPKKPEIKKGKYY
jgi:hypothetical protein